MDYRLIWSPQAIEDIQAIGEYIGLAEYDLHSVFTMRYMSLIVLQVKGES